MTPEQFEKMLEQYARSAAQIPNGVVAVSSQNLGMMIHQYLVLRHHYQQAIGQLALLGNTVFITGQEDDGNEIHD